MRTNFLALWMFFGFASLTQAAAVDGVYIISGDRHSVERFEPYLDAVEGPSHYFGVDVKPNAKSHVVVTQEILADFKAKLCRNNFCEGNVLVLGWSIGAKFVPHLVEAFPEVVFSVVLMDPMDGAPPFTKANGEKYPMNTGIVLADPVPKTLILVAELAKERGALGISCEGKGQNYPLFESQFKNQAVILTGAGHLDLLKGPFDLITKMACAPGTAAPEDVLDRAVAEFKKFVGGL